MVAIIYYACKIHFRSITTQWDRPRLFWAFQCTVHSNIKRTGQCIAPGDKITSLPPPVGVITTHVPILQPQGGAARTVTWFGGQVPVKSPHWLKEIAVIGYFRCNYSEQRLLRQNLHGMMGNCINLHRRILFYSYLKAHHIWNSFHFTASVLSLFT